MVGIGGWTNFLLEDGSTVLTSNVKNITLRVAYMMFSSDPAAQHRGLVYSCKLDNCKCAKVFVWITRKSRWELLRSEIGTSIFGNLQ